MNYKSQLKGWAIDRIIEAKKAGILPEIASMGELQNAATGLAAYAYVPREDLESTAKELFELIRIAPAGQSSVDALIGTLEHIREDRIRQQIDPMPDLPAAANGEIKHDYADRKKTAKGAH